MMEQKHDQYTVVSLIEILNHLLTPSYVWHVTATE